MCKDFKFKIQGKNYPCRITLLAMLKFKRETGRDWGVIDGNGITDLITFLWCCVSASCIADGVDFDLDIDTFAGQLGTDTFAAWTSYIKDGEDKDPDGYASKKKLP